MNTTRKLLTLAPALLLAMPTAALVASEPDSRIESRIKSSFNFKHYLSNDDISIKCSEGVVTLSGKVNMDYHKTLAEATCADTPGVKSVKNDIEVTAQPLAERSDGWITLKVKAALTFHKNVSATGTEVTTEDGVVTLKGDVENENQKELTAMYARDVDGVKDVRNEMTIGGGPRHETAENKVDDASITAQIKTSLLLHRSTHMLATKIKTRDGIVTVQGEAQNEAEKELVGKIAADTNGVKKVDNRMNVKS
jgi:osmotically-inducible protein OsmY